MSKTKPRVTVIIDEEICKGCELCVEVCPSKAMRLADGINTRGFHPAAVVDLDACTGCAQCATMCPEACIKIVKSE